MQELRELTIKKNIILTYGTLRRYFDVYIKAKKLVDSGKYGKLIQIDINFGHNQLFWSHPHSVDIILDQNLFPNIHKRYLKNSNKNCRKFIGLEYAFLDPNFIKKRNLIRRQKKEVSKIFIYLGNTGSSNILRRILKVFIDNSLNKFKIEVIFTGDAEEKNKIINLSRNHKFIKILDTQPNLADIMSSADLSIGAGGLTTWERIYLQI